MRVIVTRPEAEAAEWVAALQAAGFDAVALPLIDIRPVADAAPLHEAWRRIAEYRAAMFVSANAVRAMFAARHWGARLGVRAWATGAGTRNALLAAGVDAVLIDSPAPDAPQFDSEALWDVVQSQVRAGDRVLIVRGGEGGLVAPVGRDWLETQLTARGAAVDTVVAYLRAAPRFSAEQLAAASRAANDGCVWLFSSSQAIAHLRAAIPRETWARARAIATHPRIAQAARDVGFAVVRVSRPGLAEVIAALESADEFRAAADR